MVEKIRYFEISVKATTGSGKRVITVHKEIIKVISAQEQVDNDRLTGIESLILNSLHARDSMAPWSRVRKIREKLHEKKCYQVHYPVHELPATVESVALYEKQMETRDNHCDARIFDDVIRATFNSVW